MLLFEIESDEIYEQERKMAEIPELGRIEKIDLREAWSNEAEDFTPWLSEQGLDELGEALGLELELRSREAPVGSFALDMLCTELGTKRTVIIENQLEKTDHDHLGKLLTYAGGFDANVIVWIAKEFRDEHRQALELLNQRTGEDTEFFGLVIELWKIGNSHPAPHFKMVVAPNRIIKGESERNRRYREFFQKLIDSLREAGFIKKALVAQPSNSYYFSAGHADRVRYGARLTGRGEARIEIYIDSEDREWNKVLFDKLMKHRDDIESYLSESLEWERQDDRRHSIVAISRKGSIDDNPEKLEETRDWMVEKLPDFKRVFGPMLDELAIVKEKE